MTIQLDHILTHYPLMLWPQSSNYDLLTSS